MKKKYYDILNVSENASMEKIKSEYKKLVKKYHPDVNKEKGAKEKFKAIQEAYEVLSNKNKRKEYDELVANKKYKVAKSTYSNKIKNNNFAWKTLIVVLLVAFAFLIMFTEDKPTDNTIEYPSISKWATETLEDKPVVTVLALSTCGYCKSYKPIIEQLKEEYDFDLYWYEVDSLSDEDYSTLTSKYELLNYEGSVPYTFITNNGEFIADTTGAMEEEATLKFLKDNKVIK